MQDIETVKVCNLPSELKHGVIDEVPERCYPFSRLCGSGSKALPNPPSNKYWYYSAIRDRVCHDSSSVIEVDSNKHNYVRVNNNGVIQDIAHNRSGRYNKYVNRSICYLPAEYRKEYVEEPPTEYLRSFLCGPNGPTGKELPRPPQGKAWFYSQETIPSKFILMDRNKRDTTLVRRVNVTGGFSNDPYQLYLHRNACDYSESVTKTRYSRSEFCASKFSVPTAPLGKSWFYSTETRPSQIILLDSSTEPRLNLVRIRSYGTIIGVPTSRARHLGVNICDLPADEYYR